MEYLSLRHWISLILSLLVVLNMKVACEQKPVITTPPTGQTHIVLESKHSYSVLLKLYKQENPLPNATGWIEYDIKAPEYSYYGIMAIIQELYLRTKTNTTTNDLFSSEEDEDVKEECRDFIKFVSMKGTEKSPKICGKVESKENTYKAESLIGPRVFYEPTGHLKVQFYVNHEILPEEDYSSSSNLIGADVSFTAYTACPSTNVGIVKLERCSAQENLSCISSRLFCDGKIDCAFEHEFGVDENDCIGFKHGVVIFIFVMFICLLIYCFVFWVRRQKSHSEQI